MCVCMCVYLCMYVYLCACMCVCMCIYLWCIARLYVPEQILDPFSTHEQFLIILWHGDCLHTKSHSSVCVSLYESVHVFVCVCIWLCILGSGYSVFVYFFWFDSYEQIWIVTMSCHVFVFV